MQQRILPQSPILSSSKQTSAFLRRVSQAQISITPPANRILRRQPQSDLSYRFQRVEAAAAAAANQRVEPVRESGWFNFFLLKIFFLNH
jgi:hypothetical protein